MSEQTTSRKPLTLHRLREMPTLAQKVTQTLTIPVIGIGIGASVACSGQVLVLHDMLAVSHGKRPRFVRNFMDGSASVQCACYVEDVKASRFPVENIHTC